MSRIGDEGAPLRGQDAAGEDVGIEGGMARHRKDVAGVGIEGDQRTAAIAHGRFGGALKVEVEAHDDAVAELRRNLAQQAQAAADRVDLDLLATAVTAPDAPPT